MDRSSADESDVALADLPSTSGAHWANRDNESRRPAPFRRPPAVNSFDQGLRDDAEPAAGEDRTSWDAFVPSARSSKEETAWEAFGAEQAQHHEQSRHEQSRHEQQAPYEPAPYQPAQYEPGQYEQAPPVPEQRSRHWTAPAEAPEFGPAPPSGPGRASFGVTAGPISGTRPDMPTPAAPAPVSPPAGPTMRFGADTGEHAIGDVVSGPGREIRAHRSGRTPEAVEEKGRSRLGMAATIALTAAVLIGGGVAGVVFFAPEDQSITSMLKLGSDDGVDGKVATAPIDGRTAATLEVVAATTKVTVRMQDLGGDLYKITSAGDSGTAPSPVLAENRVQLLLSPDGEGTSGNIEVLLSTKVAWGLRFIGGADEQIADLTGGRVSSIDVSGGSRRVDLVLPAPTGTVPVRVTGAIDELSVTSPAGAPVRVQVDSGAKTVAAGAKTLRDVAPGSTLTPKDWKVANRYDVDAASRITLLTVRNAS